MKRFCYNCGKKGHVYNSCLLPVMSYGGILYRIKNQIPYYLMVQRTYTPDFKELVRGKFDLENEKYIKKLVHRITIQEINYIHTYPHQILYKNIQKYCKIKKNPQKYRQAKENYTKLKHGYTNNKGNFIKFSQLVKEDNPSYFFEPDWGFPKGRRNYKGNESDLDCAKREIKEETGLTPDSYDFKPGYYVTEVHKGSNDITYAHRYYLAKCNPNTKCYIDPYNRHQAGEIRKLGWFTVEQTLAMIRPYHQEKKKVLVRVHREITGKTLSLDGVEIHYNTQKYNHRIHHRFQTHKKNIN